MKRLVFIIGLVAASARATNVNEFALAYNAWAEIKNTFLSVGKAREKEKAQWERVKRAWDTFRAEVDKEYGNVP